MTNKDNGGINLLNWNKRRAQIIVTYDCNMNCSFCINYSLGQKKKGFIKVSDVVYFLNYLKHVEKLDDAIIVFLGGEPTLIQNQVLKEICSLCHKMGYKTEIYTNGTLKEKLLDLDGYVDYITISNYSNNLLPFENMSYLYDFEFSEITISKLILKHSFPTFEDFDKFVDEANELAFNYDFSTVQDITPNFEEFFPKWVDEELLPKCESLELKGNIGAVLYKGRLIKLPHMHFKPKEGTYTLKLYPNGNLNTTWKHDKEEIDYKGEIQRLLKR